MITADDWGFSPGVNEGILKLAQLGIVQNVAVTVNQPFWKNHLEELRKVKGLHFSLHLNFCFGRPLSAGRSLREDGEFFPSLARFAFYWATQRIRPDELREETQQQIRTLEEAIERPLETLNGHQHCHLVPGVLRSLGPILKASNIREIRLPWDAALLFSLKFPILVLSAIAKLGGSPENVQWAYAHYPLAKDFKNRRSLQIKLSRGSQYEYFFHPAIREDFDEYKVLDPYKRGRRREYERLLELAS